MNKLIFIVTLVIIFAPQVSLAKCQDEGFSIIYVNGIFTKDNEAEVSKKKLEELFNQYSKYSSEATFHLGYNPTRGELDVIKAVMQSYKAEGQEFEDQDSKRMLAKLHSQVNHKRILLIGHSQGSYYTNALYKYLRNNGINRSALAVYNIGTPASYVAGSAEGNGKYITNKTDEVINQVRVWAKRGNSNQPLQYNTHITLQDNDISNANRGHDIQRVYLAGEGRRMMQDIDALLNNLVVPKAALGSSCYFEPELSWRDAVSQLGIDSLEAFSDTSKGTYRVVTAPVRALARMFKRDKRRAEVVQDIQPVQSIQELKALPAVELLNEPTLDLEPKEQKVDFVKVNLAQEVDYSELASALAALQQLVELLKVQKPDKCAGIDLSIFKMSTCVNPFEIGGFAFGTGGAGGTAPAGAAPPPEGGLIIVVGGGPPPPGGVPAR